MLSRRGYKEEAHDGTATSPIEQSVEALQFSSHVALVQLTHLVRLGFTA